MHPFSFYLSRIHKQSFSFEVIIPKLSNVIVAIDKISFTVILQSVLNIKSSFSRLCF